MNQVLIIEDDKALSNGVALALKNEQLAISQCFDLASARQKMRSEQFDLIILDINLPDGNGLDFLNHIKQTSKSAVILLTANDLETDIVVGLEMGADDYITKPFSLAILRARVNAQLRKQDRAESSTYRQDEFVFNFSKLEFLKGDTVLSLSKTEQKLLHVLIENKGHTLERSSLVDRIWTDGAEYVDENALSVTIKRLRDKLECIPSKPTYIKTVYGIGYTWAVK